MAMKENSKRILNYLKEVNGTNVTAADVAEALGIEKRSVDGSFTSAIQRKGLGVRTPAEIELEDGTHKQPRQHGRPFRLDGCHGLLPPAQTPLVLLPRDVRRREAPGMACQWHSGQGRPDLGQGHYRACRWHGRCAADCNDRRCFRQGAQQFPGCHIPSGFRSRRVPHWSLHHIPEQLRHRHSRW